MMLKPAWDSVTIIGTGAVGLALIDFFNKQDVLIRSAWSSKAGRIQTDSGEYLEIRSNLPDRDEQIGALIFISTPDDMISTVANKLALTNIDWNQRTVVHCSGNLTSDELSSLAKAGAGVASMHPIQTFKPGDGSDRFRGITMSLEGDKKVTGDLEKIVELMHANSLHLTKEQKRALHIAAVFASNYMIALIYSAGKYLEKEGLEKGITFLEPLILQTARNIVEKGAAGSLTGPVARGDIISIRKHLNSLKTNDKMRKMYQILGMEAVEIVKLKGEISDDVIKEMLELLRL
jgi:predicted short-subunit dehydrogenase-like oxidoreductase (DUF2520 family)